MIPLAICALAIVTTEPTSRVLSSVPSYAEIHAPAQTVVGREIPVRIHLRTAEGGPHRARPTEEIRLAIEGDSAFERRIPGRSFRNGVFQTNVRFDTPGFRRLLLHAFGPSGERLLGRSLLVRVTQDPVARARSLLLVAPGRARAGDPLSVRIVPLDEAGAEVGDLDLPRFDWRLETEGVRVRLRAFEPFGLVLTPLEPGTLRIRLREANTGLSGISDTIDVAPARFERWNVSLPPILRSGEPVLIQVEAMGPNGARAAAPEGRDVLLLGSRITPDRIGVGNFANGAASAWVVFTDPGEVRLGVEERSAQAPGIHAILRVGPRSFRLLADAPADSILVTTEADAIRVVWPEGVWRGSQPRLSLGEAVWIVEDPGPPLVVRMSGMPGLATGRADRNTFRLDIADALGEDSRESDWGGLIRSGRYAEARARISSHLASHPEDTQAAEVLERLIRLERILSEPRDEAPRDESSR